MYRYVQKEVRQLSKTFLVFFTSQCSKTVPAVQKHEAEWILQWPEADF